MDPRHKKASLPGKSTSGSILPRENPSGGDSSAEPCPACRGPASVRRDAPCLEEGKHGAKNSDKRPFGPGEAVPAGAFRTFGRNAARPNAIERGDHNQLSGPAPRSAVRSAGRGRPCPCGGGLSPFLTGAGHAILLKTEGRGRIRHGTDGGHAPADGRATDYYGHQRGLRQRGGHGVLLLW